MTVGLASATANAIANIFRGGGAGVTYTAPAVQATKLHTSTGDPGAAGTSNASANTTRQATTFGAASAGAIALSNSPTWSSWASGAETLGYVSFWDSTTAGAFEWSAQLGANKSVTNGDTVTLTSATLSFGPIAA
jgi:hypothetical protein